MSTIARDSIVEDDLAHVFHSWSAQATLSPVAVAGGEGSWFWDAEGNRYLDFSSQLVNLNLGHQHPGMVEAITTQAQKLCTIAPNFANDARAEAAGRILGHAPANMAKVFFTSGGAEANENAVRMARLHTGRHKILAAYRSYHGATAGAIALTGEPRRWGSEPAGSGVVHFFGPYPYRSPFHSKSPEQETERALQHLSDVISYEGPDRIAGVVVESVTGTNGVLVPPPGYFAGLRELCDLHGIMLIADEVMSGFGRFGEWFAFDHWEIEPDLVTFAKGVNSGYVPLGGVIISGEIASTFDDMAYPGGLTYSGHPLACASACAAIQIMEDDDLIERSRRLGDELIGPRLGEIAKRHRSVGEVRGRGCMWALELVSNPDTREPLVPFNASGPDAAPMAEFGAACKSKGLWPFIHFNRTHVKPPLVIGEEDLMAGLDILDDALHVADGHCK